MFEQGNMFFEHQTVAGSTECRNGHEPDGGDYQPGNGSKVSGGGGDGRSGDLYSSPPAHPDPGWHLTKHVCNVCLGGRVLTRRTGGTREFICANCEVKGERTNRSICVCGARFSDVRRGLGKRKGGSMGLVCMRNPIRGPESPSVIVAGEKP